MERQKKRKVAVIIALLLIVIGISVAFAAMQTVLSISGTAKVSPGWDIHFESPSMTKSDTELVATAPTMSSDSLTLSNFAVTLRQPGDKVTYTFDVVNGGSADAKLDTLTKNTPTFTGAGDAILADQTLVQGLLVYTLTYTNAYANGGILAGQTVGNNDVLKAGDSVNMTITIEYPDTATSLPEDDVNITDMNIQLKYVQD